MTAFHPSVGTIWAERELAQARRMRAGALSYFEIGKALNHSADSVCAALASEQVRLGRTTFVDREHGHLVGDPTVVVDRHETGATVFLANAVWGMTRTRAEFLSANDPAIDLFVNELLTRVRLLAERELERLEKRQRAKDEARHRRPR
jgi:hypothetical protein